MKELTLILIPAFSQMPKNILLTFPGVNTDMFMMFVWVQIINAAAQLSDQAEWEAKHGENQSI